VTLRFAVSRVFSLVEQDISFLWTSTLSRLNPAKVLARWNSILTLIREHKKGTY